MNYGYPMPILPFLISKQKQDLFASLGPVVAKKKVPYLRLENKNSSLKYQIAAKK